MARCSELATPPLPSLGHHERDRPTAAKFHRISPQTCSRTLAFHVAAVILATMLKLRVRPALIDPDFQRLLVGLGGRFRGRLRNVLEFSMLVLAAVVFGLTAWMVTWCGLPELTS